MRQNQNGEKNPAAKLTEAQVRAIRAAYAAGGISQSVLARKYGVTQYNVFSIVHRMTWNHLQDGAE